MPALTAFTGDMVTFMRESFGKHETISTDHAVALGKILDKCPDDLLRQLFKARIRFVSPLALNRLIKRGVKPVRQEETMQ